MTKRQTLQFRLPTLLIVTGIIAVVLAGFVLYGRMMDGFFHDIFVGETGRVTSQDEWPNPLKRLLDETSLVKDADHIQVHCLCQGFDPEYVWRMNGDAEAFSKLAARWQLTEVANPNWHVLNGHSRNSGHPTPPWWNPRKSNTASYHVCPRSLAGQKGDRFQVAFDDANETIFVHYWFNF
ncbi:hypothetical protein CA13_16860 [Planctomycetes bacterium CA13]|uniref:Uncharacterized protein n=1 Tax=Novipirellula herctigrandis TaxID=2527986 RepID=A0A5C5Z0Q3_9BACT|nr:hypothetical protein CA13_16860 [Planctomycetes bacterium CA13]